MIFKSVFDVNQVEFLQGFAFEFSEKPTQFHVLSVRSSGNRLGTKMTTLDFRVEAEDRRLQVHLARPLLCAKVELTLASSVKPAGVGLSYFQPADVAAIRTQLKKRRIAFYLCAKNCERTLQPTLEKLIELGTSFDAFYVFIVENDSHDGTKHLIQLWEERLNGRLVAVSADGLDDLIPSRIVRLAACRNLAIQSVAHSRFDPDYLMAVDADGIVGQAFSVDGFLSCFQYEPIWDGVFPVGDKHYYDIYALRHPDISPDDYIQRIYETHASIRPEFASYLSATPRTLPLQFLSSWLQVESAFGGLGLYRWSKVKNHVYTGLEGDKEICEHVTFHRQLVQSGGSLYINPSMVIASPSASVVTQLITQHFAECLSSETLG